MADFYLASTAGLYVKGSPVNWRGSKEQKPRSFTVGQSFGEAQAYGLFGVMHTLDVE
jgi:hypothetical protein